MATHQTVLHQARVTNNCPECYNANGLEFTFAQEVNENLFMVRPKSTAIVSLYCHTCDTAIYPVSWTEDIERVYEYQKKLAEENKQHLRLKPWAYAFIIIDLLLVCGIVYYFVN